MDNGAVGTFPSGRGPGSLPSPLPRRLSLVSVVPPLGAVASGALSPSWGSSYCFLPIPQVPCSSRGLPKCQAPCRGMLFVCPRVDLFPSQLRLRRDAEVCGRESVYSQGSQVWRQTDRRTNLKSTPATSRGLRSLWDKEAGLVSGLGKGDWRPGRGEVTRVLHQLS